MEKTYENSFCSIDANSTSIAFAIWNDDTLIEYGKISWEGKTTYDKIVDASIKLSAFFKQYKTISYLVIEQTAFLNNPKTLADLSMVQGAIVAAIGTAQNIKAKSVPPIAWQTFIKNGRLTTPEKLAIRNQYPNKSAAWYKTKEREFRKQRTIDFVNSRYHKSIKDDDIADAIGIGHYAIFNWDKLF